jgi:hypothetical protein
MGFYGDPAEREIDVTIGTASLKVPLRPFNYCGDGIAQVVVTSPDAGGPLFAPVTYVNACGL